MRLRRPGQLFLIRTAIDILDQEGATRLVVKRGRSPSPLEFSSRGFLLFRLPNEGCLSKQLGTELALACLAMARARGGPISKWSAVVLVFLFLLVPVQGQLCASPYFKQSASCTGLAGAACTATLGPLAINDTVVGICADAQGNAAVAAATIQPVNVQATVLRQTSPGQINLVTQYYSVTTAAASATVVSAAINGGITQSCVWQVWGDAILTPSTFVQVNDLTSAKITTLYGYAQVALFFGDGR